MAIVSCSLSVLTLNVNGLNSQSKDTDWLNGFKKRKDSTICCLQESYFRYKDIHKLKVKEQKKHPMQI